MSEDERKGVYFWDKWSKKVLYANIERETKCFYFLDRNGIRYSKRIDKESIGVDYFITSKECIDNRLKIKITCVKNAKENLLDRENELKAFIKYAEKI